MRPALVIHGGAWAIPDGELEAHLDGLRKAVAVGRARLEAGTRALDTVVAVVKVLEDHPAFDAGVGAVLNRAGEVQLDAGVMDGTARDFGAVAGVQRIRNPIEAAHAVLERSARRYSLLVGPNADRWAYDQGLATVEPAHFVVPRETARWAALSAASRYHTAHPFRGEERGPRGTVGCVAIDGEGRIAAGTSTGGAPFTPAGRVGDSPLPGSGFYATPEGGASATGWGEAIARVVMCADAVGRLERGEGAQAAAEQAIARLAALVKDPEGCGATGGVILMNARGEMGIAFNTPRMARAVWRGEGTAEEVCCC